MIRAKSHIWIDDRVHLLFRAEAIAADRAPISFGRGEHISEVYELLRKRSKRYAELDTLNDDGLIDRLVPMFIVTAKRSQSSARRQRRRDVRFACAIADETACGRRGRVGSPHFQEAQVQDDDSRPLPVGWQRRLKKAYRSADDQTRELLATIPVVGRALDLRHAPSVADLAAREHVTTQAIYRRRKAAWNEFVREAAELLGAAI